MTPGARTDCAEIKPRLNDALRLENARLLEMLDAANMVAARYAVLLREGNHRIKNSLQIVSSLMRVQAARESHASARDALRTAANRILSVARMHDALQASGGDDRVDIGATVDLMCSSLHAMGGDSHGVDVRVEADAIHAPAAYAQPLLLAVNELVVNALRHAFPHGRTGSILVRMHCAGGQLHVLVADDGVGLPVGHGEKPGYGMRLVRMMTDQLGGVLRIDSGAGTRITIVSPEPQTMREPPGTAAHRRSGRSALGLLSRKPWNASGRG